MILAEHKIEDLEMLKHDTLGLLLSTRNVSSEYGVTTEVLETR